MNLDEFIQDKYQRVVDKFQVEPARLALWSSELALFATIMKVVMADKIDWLYVGMVVLTLCLWAMVKYVPHMLAAETPKLTRMVWFLCASIDVVALIVVTIMLPYLFMNYAIDLAVSIGYLSALYFLQCSKPKPPTKKEQKWELSLSS